MDSNCKDLLIATAEYAIKQELRITRNDVNGFQASPAVAEETSTKGITNIIRKFDRHYNKRPNVPTYERFNSESDQGIPRLVGHFKSFDPVNSTEIVSEWKNYITADDQELAHLHSYLEAPEFNDGLLKCVNFDHVANSIISYILHWNNETLLKFKRRYVKYTNLIDLVEQEKQRYPPSAFKGIPFLRCTFKLLKRYFENNYVTNSSSDDCDIVTKTVSRSLFNLNNYVSLELKNHFYSVYSHLRTESCNVASIEDKMGSPFILLMTKFKGISTSPVTPDTSDTDTNKLLQPIKVITGQSCCGKTTLLDRFREDGWNICSRSDLGTYAGKSSTPPTIATLHFAIENAMRRGDVLGDRGPIDNPLWSGIMPLCNPVYENVLVDEILSFLNSQLNEHSVAYLCNQLTVVFIDPFPSKNRERMLARGKGGDCYRARIRMYPIVQAITYYIVARLFGWRVFCVPYTSGGVFNSQGFDVIIKQCKDLFGKPLKHKEPLPTASKVGGNFILDNNYPISVGIYK